MHVHVHMMVCLLFWPDSIDIWLLGMMGRLNLLAIWIISYIYIYTHTYSRIIPNQKNNNCNSEILGSNWGPFGYQWQSDNEVLINQWIKCQNKLISWIWIMGLERSKWTIKWGISVSHSHLNMYKQLVMALVHEGARIYLINLILHRKMKMNFYDRTH